MKIEEYQGIISMAIENEAAAYEFYSVVANTTKDPSLKSIFHELAEDEKKHKIALEDCMSGTKPVILQSVKDYKVSQTIEKPKLSIDMKPADAIGLAMKEEEEAMLLYEALADSSPNLEYKQMFLALAKMEKGHKAKLEEIYTTMAFPEVW